jgi:hypothetical protein
MFERKRRNPAHQIFQEEKKSEGWMGRVLLGKQG